MDHSRRREIAALYIAPSTRLEMIRCTRGVQNPCYRSIVSNTDTFETLAVAVAACLSSP